MKTKDLYTQDDVKKVRLQLIKEQDGNCAILQEKIKNIPVLDHDHDTQKVRGVLDRSTNSFEGIVKNAFNRHLKWCTKKSLPEVLILLAEYLSKDNSDLPTHPGWIKTCQTVFSKLNAVQQKNVLKQLEIPLPEQSNLKIRKKVFRSFIIKKKIPYLTVKEKLDEEIEKTK